MPPTKVFCPPRKQDVETSIDACLVNGDRLMDDALRLEFQEEGGTRMAICVLAQEEYAKAFLLYLVREMVVPWDSDLLRAIRSHTCKHLLAIVMEYIAPQWDTVDELREIIRAEYDLDGRFPPHVSSALNILYFEKIRRGDFFDDNDYEPSVLAVAFGERDKAKQNAVYVDLDKSCRVKSTPVKSISREAAQKEYETAERYGSIVNNLVSPDSYEGAQLKRVKDATRVVFWQKYRAADSTNEG